MNTTGASAPADAITAATRQSEAVEAADTLLYHAISNGHELPAPIRDPIIGARVTLRRGQVLAPDEEGRFLDAYAKLAVRVAPVTAATLDATSRRRGRRGWLGRLLGLRPVSDAQRLSSCFGALALCLIAAIAAGEWARTLIGSVAVAEQQFGANSKELRAANVRLISIEEQVEMLERGGGAVADPASAGAVREALEAQRGEVSKAIWALEYANGELDDTIRKGYATLGQMLQLGEERVKHVAMPLGNILGGFLLPLLYGALGTCAFVMRSLFREMVDRSFDGRRTGEFTVRIFLGMLSGLSLQWLIVRPDGSVAGGMTPAVLAFLGGYSVEMLFTALDRLVHLVAGRIRSPGRAPAPGRSRPERPAADVAGPRRPRARHAVNGAAPGAVPPANGAAPGSMRSASGAARAPAPLAAGAAPDTVLPAGGAGPVPQAAAAPDTGEPSAVAPGPVALTVIAGSGRA